MLRREKQLIRMAISRATKEITGRFKRILLPHHLTWTISA